MKGRKGTGDRYVQEENKAPLGVTSRDVRRECVINGKGRASRASREGRRAGEEAKERILLPVFKERLSKERCFSLRRVEKMKRGKEKKCEESEQA